MQVFSALHRIAATGAIVCFTLAVLVLVPACIPDRKVAVPDAGADQQRQEDLLVDVQVQQDLQPETVGSDAQTQDVPADLPEDIKPEIAPDANPLETDNMAQDAQDIAGDEAEEPQPFCGDGECHKPAENCKNCEVDCGECVYCNYNGECETDFDKGLVENIVTCIDDCHACGDAYCNPAYETCQTCPGDCVVCPECGNKECEAGEGLNSEEPCPADCGTCGDGLCSAIEQMAENCAYDCMAVCGDGTCGKGEFAQEQPGDNYVLCPQDCGWAGDGVCSMVELVNPDGLYGENPIDCLNCGDDICTPEEKDGGLCPKDCAVCGDGVCNLFANVQEDCPADCLQPCGDGLCEMGETYQTCPIDCGGCGDDICTITEFQGGYCLLDCNELCGDGLCTAPYETEQSCAQDCASCLVVCEDGWECGDDLHNCGQKCGACPQEKTCIEHICTE